MSRFGRRTSNLGISIQGQSAPINNYATIKDKKKTMIQDAKNSLCNNQIQVSLNEKEQQEQKTEKDKNTLELEQSTTPTANPTSPKVS